MGPIHNRIEEAHFHSGDSGRPKRHASSRNFPEAPSICGVFCCMQERIRQLKIAHACIPAPALQMFLDFFILFLRHFHAGNTASIQEQTICGQNSGENVSGVSVKKWNHFFPRKTLPSGLFLRNSIGAIPDARRKNSKK